MTSSLLVKPDLSAAGGRVHQISPQRAGWQFIGFDVIDVAAGARFEAALPAREQCIVLVSGRAGLTLDGRDLGTIGERATPFAGKPYAVYVPPRVQVVVSALTPCELAVCSAPAEGRLPARLIRPVEVGDEVRGTGTNTRYVRDILPGTAAAERLLVVEVITPGGHWSSYPPHKHDAAQGAESPLEETYYHRLSGPGGFAFQRVYTEDRSLDETMSVEDRDVVLVPRGYHPVSAPHGFDLYYLNAMAGPVRRWQPSTAPGYDFLNRRS
jgi:5-deoxy-glucuronate isomerase